MEDRKELSPVRDGVAGWEICEFTLPQGFRLVGTVDRDDGDTYDMGQNAEGKFAMFRRSKDPWMLNSHGNAEPLSDIDLAGFELFRHNSIEPERAAEDGDYSSLVRSHLITQGV